MDKKKCQRCCNMTSSEKVLLADLVAKYSGVIENILNSSLSYSSNGFRLVLTLRVFYLYAVNTANIVNYTFTKLQMAAD